MSRASREACGQAFAVLEAGTYRAAMDVGEVQEWEWTDEGYGWVTVTLPDGCSATATFEGDDERALMRAEKEAQAWAAKSET
jgi:hypothetical protein